MFIDFHWKFLSGRKTKECQLYMESKIVIDKLCPGVSCQLFETKRCIKEKCIVIINMEAWCIVCKMKEGWIWVGDDKFLTQTTVKLMFSPKWCVWSNVYSLAVLFLCVASLQDVGNIFPYFLYYIIWQRSWNTGHRAKDYLT